VKYAKQTRKGAKAQGSGISAQGSEVRHDGLKTTVNPSQFVSQATRHFFWVGSLIVLFSLAAPAVGPEIAVELDISSAGPRKIEAQTEGRILADYRMAWADIAQALNSNDSGPVEGIFTGAAKQWLDQTVATQRQTGISTRYSNQTHRLQAVFYAPEGDLIALHDTAEYDRQVLAGGKVILEDRGVHRYVVLMTPGADRWVVRELIEVQNF
jgi:hypothetical protein